MSFYRERIIKKPRKNHTCQICGKIIAGAHVYISAKYYDFFYEHRHYDCHEKMEAYCQECILEYGECNGRTDACEWEALKSDRGGKKK